MAQMHTITTAIPAAALALATTLDDSGFPSVWFMRNAVPTVITMAPTNVVVHVANMVAALFGARGLL